MIHEVHCDDKVCTFCEPRHNIRTGRAKVNDYNHPPVTTDSSSDMVPPNATIYGVWAHGSLPSPQEESSFWDQQKIDKTVTQNFIRESIGGGKDQARLRTLLDMTLSFGEGLTESTYSEWIVEHAKIIFLILLELGIPEEIIRLVDASWGDDDLPFSPKMIDKLELGNSSLEKKFLKKQHMFMLRCLEAGDHIDYHEDETVPVEVANTRRQGINLGILPVEKVYLPRRKETLFTRMKIPLSNDERSVPRKLFLAEIEAMKAALHPHIVSIFASYTHEGCGYLLLSPVCEINLRQFIHFTPNIFKSLPKDERRRTLFDWMHCLSNALAYLHEKGLMHRDIRPKTVFIDQSTNQIYFANIGNSKRLYPTLKQSSYDIEAYEYAAPELWQRSMASLEAPIPTSTVLAGRSYQKISNPSAATGNSENSNNSNTLVDPTTYISFQTPQWFAISRNPSKSDTFSLGCIFLDILSFYAKRRPSTFAAHRGKRRRGSRQTAKPDESFHANLAQVESWIDGLRKEVWGKQKDHTFLGILNVVRDMLNYSPDARPYPRGVEMMLFGILRKEFEPHQDQRQQGQQCDTMSSNYLDSTREDNQITPVSASSEGTAFRVEYRPLHCQPTQLQQHEQHLSRIALVPRRRRNTVATASTASTFSEETILSVPYDTGTYIYKKDSEAGIDTILEDPHTLHFTPPYPFPLHYYQQQPYHNEDYFHPYPISNYQSSTQTIVATSPVTTSGYKAYPAPSLSSDSSSSASTYSGSSASSHSLPILPHTTYRKSITSHTTTSSSEPSTTSAPRAVASSSFMGVGGGRSKRSGATAAGLNKTKEKEADKDRSRLKTARNLGGIVALSRTEG